MLKKQFLMVCLFLLLPYTILADTEGINSPYTVETADKKYIFVMLKGGDRDNPSPRSFGKYPFSGMYLNDGNMQPLWTVDWYGPVILPSDGIHVIRRGFWARTSEGYDQEAITFYAYGHPLKTYQVSDLVDCPWLLPHTASHFEWQRTIELSDESNVLTLNVSPNNSYPYNQGVVIDDQTSTMKLETMIGDVFTFHINTGEVLSARRPLRRIFIFALSLFALIYAAYLFRVTARPRPGLWKKWKAAFLVALALATSLAIAGLAVEYAYPKQESIIEHPALVGFWKATFYLPLFIAEKFEWRLQILESAGVLGITVYIILFWFVIFLVAGALNKALVQMLCAARARLFNASSANIVGGSLL